MQFFGALCLVAVLCSVLLVKGDSQCSQFQSCDSCIQSHSCKWCSDIDFNGPRCVAVATSTGSCRQYQDPRPTVTIIEGLPLNDSIQMSPQRTSLRLRLGQSATVDLTIKPAANFPLDVYFLMDYSLSMREEIAQMRVLARTTGSALGKITEDFRYGVGSFVDKNTDPYHLSHRRSGNTCPGQNIECVQPYTFRQHLKLSPDNPTSLRLAFAPSVYPLSANWDNPEAGTDALMQAVACKNIIGWRDFPARHLLVYISDQALHLGTDGKIGGVVTPHDGGCHLVLNDDGVWATQATTAFAWYQYSKALELDYPSVSMVAKKMQDESVFPIFGVVTNPTDDSVYQTYTNSSSVFPNAVVMPLHNSASNLLGALEAAYQSISSRILLEVSEGASEDISIKFESKCNGTEWMETRLCEGVVINQEVPFRVIVTVDKCTPKLRNGTSLTISSGFFGKVTVDVQAICDCSCTGSNEARSPVCSGFGDLVCGQCVCDPGRCGKQCQCDCGLSSNGTTDLSALTCPTGAGGEVCSGAGECFCGECKCAKNVGGNPGFEYYGDTCECNNFKCGKDEKGKICSGHGTCSCGECVCDKAPSGNSYRGEICDCYPDEDVCRMQPDDESPCSGHGTCVCGQCRCDPSSGYGGQYCQDCKERRVCGKLSCGTYSGCISCLFVVEGGILRQKDASECHHVCSNFTLFVQSDTLSHTTQSDLLQCSYVITGEACQASVQYRVYLETDDQLGDVYISVNAGNCVPMFPLWAIVVPIVIGLLVVAIAIIVLIKAILIYLDYREYKNWMSEVKKIQFSEFESPLYRAAEQTYYCPLYPGNLQRGLVGSVSPHLARKALEAAISLPDLASETEKQPQPAIPVQALRGRAPGSKPESGSDPTASLTGSSSRDSIVSDTSAKIADLLEALHGSEDANS